MKALIQRVSFANVRVNGQKVAEIKKGLLVFLGIEKQDSEKEADYLAQKIANLRIFEDQNGKMNLSVKEIKGEILIVSQFTLAADTTRGNRPGFEQAAHPENAKKLYEYFSQKVSIQGLPIQNGVFQADMKVELLNEGPATFLLEKRYF